jgi:site-specific recombinase XerD
MDPIIEQLAQDLARAAYADGTRTRYCAGARELSAFCGKPIAQIGRDEIRAFVDAVMAREISAQEKTNRLCALRYLYRRSLGRPEMVSFIKLPRRHSPLPVVLSQGEVRRLFDAFHNPRYQAIAMVMYGAGLRVSEAIALTVSDIDRERGVLHVRCGKGGKPRETKLSPLLYQWLRTYWAFIRPPLPHLFADPRGRLPLADTVRKAVRTASRQAGIDKRVTPHVLRHSFATHLLEEGTDVRVVGALLGHASLRATTQYARVTEKLVRQAPSPLDLLPQPRH